MLAALNNRPGHNTIEPLWKLHQHFNARKFLIAKGNMLGYFFFNYTTICDKIVTIHSNTVCINLSKGKGCKKKIFFVPGFCYHFKLY